MPCFGFLGALLVCPDGERIEITGLRSRTVLAWLLLHPGEALSTERLIDVMYGEAPPRSARNQIQIAIHGLRKSALPVVTTRDGYRFDAPAGAIDGFQAQKLLADGRAIIRRGLPDVGGTILRTAEALWRGPAFCDVAGEAIRAQAVRWNDLRTRVTEERIDADLLCDRYDDVLDELRGLIIDHPSREILHAQLMRALYRCGRPVEALDVYESLRRHLADTLGTLPSAQLRGLHARILKQDLEPVLTRS